jgi:hypothetical protein
MALEKGENSFVSLDEAVEYLSMRLDAAAWVAASTLMQEQSLVTATMILNTLNWSGTAISEDQSLAFPRIGVYLEPILGIYKSFPDDIPTRISIGTCEMAYHLLNNDGLLDDIGTVTSLNVGQISLNIKKYPNRIPSIVKSYINPMLENQGKRTWWRAN